MTGCIIVKSLQDRLGNSLILGYFLVMKFRKFKILNIEDNAPIKENAIPIVFNMDHIVSVKPINIMIRGDVVKGYWIRLSNGKKYKALEIPIELKELLAKEKLEDSNFNQTFERPEQQEVILN